LMDKIKLMLRAVWMLLSGNNSQLISRIELHQARTERIQDELKEYLSQVSDENLSEADIDLKLTILDYSQELTNIGILIQGDLCDAVLRHIQSSHEFSTEDRDELEALYARTLERIERAALVLMTRDPALAERFIREKEEINTELRKSRKARLERPIATQNVSSKVFDIVNCLRRINSQLTSLAYTLARDSPRLDQPSSQERSGRRFIDKRIAH